MGEEGGGREKGERRREKGEGVPVESALFVEELEEEGSGGFAVDFGSGGGGGGGGSDGDSAGGRHCAGWGGGIEYTEKI